MTKGSAATEGRTIEVEANGILFKALEYGAGREAPLALCIHGFPDNPRTFLHQVPALVEAGYRVVTPWTRGYAPTAPSPTGHYQTAVLGRDIIALADALSPDEQVVVFGHDWGALASYAAAIHAPHRIRKLVTAAVPYGPSMQTSFLTNYDQQKRSWYIFFFQTPLAEGAVAHDDMRFIRNLWREWSPHWEFTEEDIRPVLDTLGQPGVLEAAIDYYRCILDPARQDPALAEEQALYGFAPVEVPTLYFHGRSCGCMGVELCEGMETVFPKGLEKVYFDRAGHFVHRENPVEVNDRIIKFLAE